MLDNFNKKLNDKKNNCSIDSNYATSFCYNKVDDLFFKIRNRKKNNCNVIEECTLDLDKLKRPQALPDKVKIVPKRTDLFNKKIEIVCKDYLKYDYYDNYIVDDLTVEIDYIFSNELFSDGILFKIKDISTDTYSDKLLKVKLLKDSATSNITFAYDVVEDNDENLTSFTEKNLLILEAVSSSSNFSEKDIVKLIAIANDPDTISATLDLTLSDINKENYDYTTKIVLPIYDDSDSDNAEIVAYGKVTTINANNTITLQIDNLNTDVVEGEAYNFIYYDSEGKVIKDINSLSRNYFTSKVIINPGVFRTSVYDASNEDINSTQDELDNLALTFAESILQCAVGSASQESYCNDYKEYLVEPNMSRVEAYEYYELLDLFTSYNESYLGESQESVNDSAISESEANLECVYGNLEQTVNCTLPTSNDTGVELTSKLASFTVEKYKFKQSVIGKVMDVSEIDSLGTELDNTAIDFASASIECEYSNTAVVKTCNEFLGITNNTESAYYINSTTISQSATIEENAFSSTAAYTGDLEESCKTAISEVKDLTDNYLNAQLENCGFYNHKMTLCCDLGASTIELDEDGYIEDTIKNQETYTVAFRVATLEELNDENIQKYKFEYNSSSKGFVTVNQEIIDEDGTYYINDPTPFSNPTDEEYNNTVIAKVNSRLEELGARIVQIITHATISGAYALYTNTNNEMVFYIFPSNLDENNITYIAPDENVITAEYYFYNNSLTTNQINKTSLVDRIALNSVSNTEEIVDMGTYYFNNTIRPNNDNWSQLEVNKLALNYLISTSSCFYGNIYRPALGCNDYTCGLAAAYPSDPILPNTYITDDPELSDKAAETAQRAERVCICEDNVGGGGSGGAIEAECGDCNTACAVFLQ